MTPEHMTDEELRRLTAIRESIRRDSGNSTEDAYADRAWLAALLDRLSALRATEAPPVGPAPQMPTREQIEALKVPKTYGVGGLDDYDRGYNAALSQVIALLPSASQPSTTAALVTDVEMARAHLAEIDAADVVAICPPVKCEVCQGTGVVDGPDYCDACGAAGEYLDEQALIEWRVQKLAALISAARGAERERCARIADEEYQRQASPIHRSAQRAANAIRALPKEPTP